MTVGSLLAVASLTPIPRTTGCSSTSLGSPAWLVESYERRRFAWLYSDGPPHCCRDTHQASSRGAHDLQPSARYVSNTMYQSLCVYTASSFIVVRPERTYFKLRKQGRSREAKSSRARMRLLVSFSILSRYIVEATVSGTTRYSRTIARWHGDTVVVALKWPRFLVIFLSFSGTKKDNASKKHTWYNHQGDRKISQHARITLQRRNPTKLYNTNELLVEIPFLSPDISRPLTELRESYNKTINRLIPWNVQDSKIFLNAFFLIKQRGKCL